MYKSLYFKCGCPLMIPPAPNSSRYIDKYPEGADLSDCNKKSKFRQEDYTAEVTVYRVLERLDDNVIVIHGMVYNHGDYQIFVGDHKSKKKPGEDCTLKNKEREEECDFLIIGSNYITIIEVKNIIIEDNLDVTALAEQLSALTTILHNSVEQRLRTRGLIKGINKDVVVHCYTACPNLSKGKLSNLCVDADLVSTIIFKEELNDFPKWWMDHISIPGEIALSPLRDTYILLALWCTEKNKCDKLKCSMGQTIANIDKCLKDGDFTFISKNRDPNPGVASEIPPMIKEHFGLKNLTVEQLSALNSDKKFLWINGPAGVGKSVVIMGKILKLAKSNDKHKIALFHFVSNCDNYSYQNLSVLESAKIKYMPKILPDSWHWKGRDEQYAASALCDKISVCHQSNQVAVIVLDEASMQNYRKPWLSKIIGRQKHCSLFIDDFQSLFSVNNYIYSDVPMLTNTLIELSCANTVWVACDVAQAQIGPYYLYSLKPDTTKDVVISAISKIPQEQWVNLTKNMRNTFELSAVLSVLRDFVREYFRRTVCLDYDFKFTDVLPPNKSGHFIHGPLIDIHVFNQFDGISEVVDKEIDRICNANILDQNKDIGILHSLKTIKIQHVMSSKTLHHYRNIYSNEWPVVFAIHEMYTATSSLLAADEVSQLYIFISRARVKCFLFLLLGTGRSNESIISTNDLLGKVKTIANIIQHD